MKFANRMGQLKPSDIREVGKMVMPRPGTISFAGGLPDPKLFPAKEMRSVAEYKIRRDLMIKVIKEEFPAEVKYYYPEGGMFVWVELPSHVNTRELLKKAIDKKVAFVPGGSFYPDGKCESAFRINFSNMERDKIVQGMKILAELLKSEL